MDVHFRKNHLLNCWDCISPLNWFGALKSLKLIQENWSLDLFYEVYFFWGCCYLSLWINHTALQGILPYLGWCSWLLFGYVRQATEQVCRTVGPSPDAFLEHLALCHNIVSLSLSYWYYFGWTGSSSLLSWEVSSLFYKLHFSVAISTCYKDVCININNFFLARARLWNSFPEECFFMTFDLYGSQRRVIWYLLYLDTLYTLFIFSLFLFL